MEDVRNLEEEVLRGTLSAIDFACLKLEGQIARMREKNPDLLWTVEIQESMWQMFRDAKKNGKKLIFFGGSIPTEIIAAMINLHNKRLRIIDNKLLQSFSYPAQCIFCKWFLAFKNTWAGN